MSELKDCIFQRMKTQGEEGRCFGKLRRERRNTDTLKAVYTYILLIVSLSPNTGESKNSLNVKYKLQKDIMIGSVYSITS